MPDKKEPTSKFYLVAQEDGSYSGTIQLENGKQYSGKLYANESEKGMWYRGNFVALDASTHAKDGALLRAFMQSGESGPKPLELRLNGWTGGKTDLIGTLITSDGAWTVFANSKASKGRLTLRGSIRPKVDKKAERVSVERVGEPVPNMQAAPNVAVTVEVEKAARRGQHSGAKGAVGRK
ncbi:MAG: hypothetical protein AB7F78_13685 [Hyphomicrobiaceae bacterium]